MATRVVCLFLLVGAAVAVPVQIPAASQCRRSCQASEVSKFRYATGKTYSYEFQSESSVKVGSIQNQEGLLKWSARVDLHFESPCQVTLEIKNPLLEGRANQEFSEQLTKYPLRAVMADGTFSEVCVHQQDEPSAVNIKKGILSSLQNSLPSNSSMHDGIEIEETDVLGVCPTVYKIHHESSKIIVEKSKDHHLCSKRFSHPSESSISEIPLKSPAPLKESKSLCRQEIEDGIIKVVTCDDQNEVVVMPVSAKTIMAQQKSELRFLSESNTEAIMALQEVRETSLLYDYSSPQKLRSEIQEVESLLQTLCATLESHTVNNQTAQVFSNLIHAMDRVQESSISEVLEKIKIKTYCNASDKLESLYLDAVRSTINPGAIPVMVQEIQKGNRLFQYTLRLYTFPRVCMHAVEAIKPLFENDTLPITVKLAAGSIVSRYCKINGECLEKEHVKQIMQLVSAKIQQSCERSLSDPNQSHISIAQLKAIGNVKNVTEQLRSTVLRCFRQSTASQNVRLAAAEVLRDIPCSEEVTRTMLTESKNAGQDAEVRIFAYKAAVKCASEEQLASLIDDVTQTSDVQVRAYILSDLTNLQQSTAPFKLAIRRRLTQFNIPQNFLSNYSSISRSFDLSTYTQSGSFGAELDSNLIYDSVGQFPRQLRTNLTIDLFKKIINVGELGIRMENLPALLQSAVSPGSILGETSVGKLLRDILPRVSATSDKQQLEFFVKLLGQEVFYHDFIDVQNSEKDLLVKLTEALTELYKGIVSGRHVESYTGYHSKEDIHISTAQGIPLKISQDLAAVVSMNASPNLQQLRFDFEISPVVSVIANYFVGYSFGPSVGIRHNNTLYSSSDSALRGTVNFPMTLDLKLEFLRDEIELFKFDSSSYVMVKLPGEAEQVKESSSEDPRLASSWCSPAVAGVKLCSEYDVADPLRGRDYPFVKNSHVKFVVMKENPSIQGYDLKISKKPNTVGYQMSFGIPGTPNPSKLVLEVDYDRTESEQSITMQSEILQRRHGLKIVHKKTTSPEESQAVEIFVTDPARQHSGEKVFLGKVSRSVSNEAKLEIKTAGSLMQVLLIDIEVEAALPRQDRQTSQQTAMESIRLDKFEVVVGAGQCKVESHIRKTSQSQEQSEYSSRAELACAGRRILELQGTSKAQRVEDGFKLENELKLEHLGLQCEARLDLGLSSKMRLFRFEWFTGSRDKQLEILASDIEEHSTQDRATILALHVPKMDIDLKMTSHIKKVSDQREVDVALTSQRAELASVRGSVSGHWSESIRQRTQLGIRFGQHAKTYHIISDIDITSDKNFVKLVLSEEQKLLISYIHNVRQSVSSLSVFSQIEVPDILKTDLVVSVTPSRIETDAEVKLEVYSPRHLHGFFIVDSTRPSQGHISAKLLWDKSRDPEKNVQVSGTYDIEDDNHLSVQGDILLQRERFHYAVTSFLKYSEDWRMGEKHFEIELMKGSEEYFTLRSIGQYQDTLEGLTVDSDFYVLTPYKNEYHLKHEIEIPAPLDSSNRLRLECSMSATTLGAGRGSLLISKRRMPSEYVFTMEGNYQVTKVNEHRPSIDIQYMAKIDQTLDGDLKDFDVDVTVESSGQKFTIQVSEDNVAKKIQVSVKKNDRHILQGFLKQLEGNAFTAQIDVSSTSAEVSGRYDEEQKSLSIYPNRHNKAAKFDASFTNRASAEGKQLELALEYPQNGRQKKVGGSLHFKNQETETSVELDVLLHEDDSLKLKVNISRVDQGIYRFVTSLQSKMKEDGPKIIVDVATIPGNMYFSASYGKDSRTPPSIYIASRYTQQSAAAGVVLFVVSTPEKKIELGGTTMAENNYGCQGQKLYSTLEVSSGQTYEVEVVVCYPGFVKVIAGAKDSSEKYVAKLGLRSFAHAEMSLVKDVEVTANSWWTRLSGRNLQQQEIPVMALSARLQTPVTLALRAQYNQQSLAPSMSLFSRELFSAKVEVCSLLQEMSLRISTDIDQAFPELKDLFDELTAKAWQINEQLQQTEAMKMVAAHLPKISDIFKQLLEKMHEIFEKMKVEIDSVLINLKTHVDNAIEKVEDWIESLLRKIGSYFGTGQDIWSLSAANVWQRMEQCQAGQKIKSWYEKLCEGEPSVCEAVKRISEEYLVQLGPNLQKVVDLVLQDKSVQYARSVVRRYVDMAYNKEYLQLLQSAVMSVTPQNVGARIEATDVQLNLPLRQPVASVLAAPSYIGFVRRQPERQTSTQMSSDSSSLPIRTLEDWRQ